MSNYLYEGQVERLDTCIIAQKKPLIVAEQHYLQRLKVDRNFIDVAKIQGLSTDVIEEDILNEVGKLRNDLIKIWKTKNAKLLNIPKTKPIPLMQACTFVIYTQYPIKFEDPNLEETREYYIEIASLVSVGNVYSLTYEKDLVDAWKKDGFKEVNMILASKAPTEFSPLIFKQMNYNTPYVFIETTVPTLIHPTNAKWGFRNKKVTQDIAPITFPTKEISYLAWNKLFKKVEELPAMRGNYQLIPNSK